MDPECQQSDWNKHKVFCKTSHAVENDPGAGMILTGLIKDDPCTDTHFLNMIADKQAGTKMRLFQLKAGRPFDLIERNLVGWEPRCMACTRTEQDIRILAAQSQTSPTGTGTRSLQPCPDCRISFFCCEDHRSAAQNAHAKQACEDGRDGLTQCQMNQQIRAEIRFGEILATANSTSAFHWAPERIKPAWISLKASSWSNEFKDDLTHQFQQSADLDIESYLCAASDQLTMPMTILWALEHLNDTDAWTRQHTLTVHILGASDREVNSIKVFEEILHQLPEVKTLKLLLCGPEISTFVGWRQRSTVNNMTICSNCRGRGRASTHQYSDLTYHGFVQRLGKKYVPPDLAIAFNSGSSQEAVASWKETMQLLAKRNIPTVFTAFNREEADAEAGILRNVGARLFESLGPRKNPWGSILVKKEPNHVDGFYAVNGWLAGGFK